MAKDNPTPRAAPASSSLDALRRRIDELDDGLQDLLVRRAELVEEVAGLKREGKVEPFRPGREARVLRRLVGRHRGRFPRPSLVRIWREIMSAAVAMQAEISIAVCDGCGDLARDHFGSQVPMLGTRSADEAMIAVEEGCAALGVLPLTEEDDPDPWWLKLPGSCEAPPQIVARLPFGTLGNAAPQCRDAFVIAAMDPEPSGDDCTLVAILGAGARPSADLTNAFLAAGIDINLIAMAEGDGGPSYLVEIDALVVAGDPRLAQALAPLGTGLRVLWLGAYARPLPDAALGGVAPE